MIHPLKVTLKQSFWHTQLIDIYKCRRFYLTRIVYYFSSDVFGFEFDNFALYFFRKLLINVLNVPVVLFAYTCMHEREIGVTKAR